MCKESRWKHGTNESTTHKKGVPAKVLWYFPPIPRFQRLFNSKDTSKMLTWHSDNRSDDGVLRHPCDSPNWKVIDNLSPQFSSDPRNLCLAIAADGINPHSSLSSRYSCWPAIMVTYNLPSWLCMKRKFMMLTLLISGPKQPGVDIDVYLQPLIDDLKTLWNDGVNVYDAHKEEHFNLRGVLLWTINDFPAYGNLSGHATKGYKGCPICSDGTSAKYLVHGRKMSYRRHMRFFPSGHKFRYQKKPFDGEEDHDHATRPLRGIEILRQLNGMTFKRYEKMKKNSPR